MGLLRFSVVSIKPTVEFIIWIIDFIRPPVVTRRLPVETIRPLVKQKVFS